MYLAFGNATLRQYASSVLNICWRMFQVSIANGARGGISIVDECTRRTLLSAAHQRYSLHTNLARLAAHLARVPRIPIGVRARTAFPQTGTDFFRILTLQFFSFLHSQIFSNRGGVVMVNRILHSLVLSGSVLFNGFIGWTLIWITQTEAYHQTCL